MSDDAVSTDEQQIIDDAIAFAANHIEPLAETWERERRFASEAFAAMPGAGLTALLVPPALGGRGAGEVTLARILEELAAVDLAPPSARWCTTTWPAPSPRAATTISSPACYRS